jgi:tape measure domain-containing protein
VTARSAFGIAAAKFRGVATSPEIARLEAEFESILEEIATENGCSVDAVRELAESGELERRFAVLEAERCLG